MSGCGIGLVTCLEMPHAQPGQRPNLEFKRPIVVAPCLIRLVAMQDLSETLKLRDVYKPASRSKGELGFFVYKKDGRIHMFFDARIRNCGFHKPSSTSLPSGCASNFVDTHTHCLHRSVVGL